MTRQRQLKIGYFLLEGLNSLAIVYYSYYLYFYLQKTFDFGNQANLAVAALSGFVYMFAAWWGGRFAQRYGYFTSLKLGFALMAGSLLAGSQLNSAVAQIIVMCVMVVGMCFTWPTLEALVSEGESGVGLQVNVGIYNIVWAGTGAAGFFVGGAILERLGIRSLFYLPVVIQLVQLVMTFWLENKSRQVMSVEKPACAMIKKDAAPSVLPIDKSFLRMAWLANPFAYIAINTLVPFIPEVARKFHLSATLAGFCCSVWCFARLGAFFWLRYWTGWHYRFRWLLGAFIALVLSFALILLTPSLFILVTGQIVFGTALGIIYSSSLFYSMDGSEAKGEHGGVHEAAIGLGNFVGPALAALSIYAWPSRKSSGVWAVSGCLLLGLICLVAIRLWNRLKRPPSLTQ